MGIKTVGLDFIPVDRFGSQDFPCHRTLLGAKTMIIEGLDLENVEQGEYFLVCLPIKLKTPDGAWARAVLVKE